MIRHREYYNNLRQLHNYTIIALYICTWTAFCLKHLPNTFCMASIQRWTEPLASLLPWVSSFLFWLNQYLAVCFTGSHSTLNPPFRAGRPNTSIQANNTATTHRMYIDMHLYITFIPLSILFFTLLPFSWASWLAQTLPVWHTYFLLLFPSTDFLCKRPLQICIYVLLPAKAIIKRMSKDSVKSTTVTMLHLPLQDLNPICMLIELYMKRFHFWRTVITFFM